jgi:hypothetical protein
MAKKSEQQDIQDWLAGPGAIPVAVIVALLALSLIVTVIRAL